MWSAPVTFGGGIAMEYGGLPEAGSARVTPEASHLWIQRGSTSAGVYSAGGTRVARRVSTRAA
jgi:hypothetical protein